MPLIKQLGQRSKKSSKNATLTLTTLKSEGQHKRMSRNLAQKEGALPDKNVSRVSQTVRWQKSDIELEQPKTESLLEGLLEKSDLEKIMEEIESKGSSSASEDLEVEKEDIEPELDLPMAEDTQILDFDINSVERSSSLDDIDGAELHGKVESETKFLDVFAKVPEMDEISLDLLEQKEDPKSQQHEKKKQLETRPSTRADLGKFFDPVTGLSDSNLNADFKSPSDEELELENVDEEEYEEQIQHQEISSIDDVFKDGSKQSPDDFEPAEVMLQDEENIFDLFMESIEPQKFRTAEEVVLDKKMLEQKKQIAIENTVIEFLNRLIDHCVSHAEFNENDTILRRSLDKYKLMSELKRICDLLDFERNRSKFLNRKIVAFFKRKGTFRPIMPDLPKAIASNRSNFVASLNVLDEWMNREEKTKTLSTDQISLLRQEFEEKQHECFEKISQLEQLISTTFQRKNFAKLQNYITNVIQKMSAVRSEISEVRIKLLLEQHQFSVLKKKLEQLEDLGNGLNIRQYESLQTETVAVSKKIEENNNTLQKLHRHFRDNLHKIAHAKEKESILKNVTAAQKQFLEEVIEKERMLRKEVHQFKLQRNHLKHETNNLMHRAGLLSNQILLRDYDRTEEKATKLHQTNEELQRIIMELNSKISKLA